jgi:hypothetical protein
MGLVLLPEEATRRKSFYVTGVRKYYTTGADPKHLPPWFVAGLALNAAKAQGCDEIVVNPEGMRPRRYAVKKVEEIVRRNPQRFKGLVRTTPLSPIEKLVARAHLRTGSGLLQLDS